MPLNSQFKLVCSQSAWPLDASTHFLLMNVPMGCYCSASANPLAGDSGELQNHYTIVHSNHGDIYAAVTCSGLSPLGDPGLGPDLIPSIENLPGNPGSGPIYNRTHTLSANQSFSQPTGMHIYQTQSIEVQLITAYSDANPLSGTHPIGFPQLYAGNALWETDRLANCESYYPIIRSSSAQGVVAGVENLVNPFYDDYPKYNELMRLKNQDYSIIPEFRISEHLPFYLNERKGNFLAINASEFEIPGVTGSETFWISGENNIAEQVEAQNLQNSSQPNFYKIYSNSDFMKQFSRVRHDHEDFVDPTTIKLTCKALLKLNPYDGFYPADRTLQIAHLAKMDYGSHLTPHISGAEAVGNIVGELLSNPTSASAVSWTQRPFWSILFGPGLLYNSIKSGMAVDYPVYTGSYANVNYQTAVSGAGTGTGTGFGTATGSLMWALGTGSLGTGGFDYRVPFEALVEPHRYLANNIPLFDMEPNPDAGYNYGFYKDSQNNLPLPTSNIFQKYPETASFWESLSIAWNGNQNTGLYVRAINNFLGEVPEFFLPRGKFSSISSAKEQEFGSVVSGNYYGMRVKLYRTMDGERQWSTRGLNHDGESVIDFELPQDPINARFSEPPLKENFTLYSRPSAFGPPCAATGSFATGEYYPTLPSTLGAVFGNPLLRLRNIGRRPSDATQGFYCPYTPPYKDGEAWADIIFRPPVSRDTGELTINEIQNNMMILLQRIDPLVYGEIQEQFMYNADGLAANDYHHPSYDSTWYNEGVGSQGNTRLNAIWNATSGTGGLIGPDIESAFVDARYPLGAFSANNYAMQLNASINLFGREDNRWVMQPKFETPHYNFNNIKSDVGYIPPADGPSETSSATNPNSVAISLHGSESVPRGMWHQFGQMEDQKGIYLEINDIPQNYIEHRLINHWPADQFGGGLSFWYPGRSRIGSREPGVTEIQSAYYGFEPDSSPVFPYGPANGTPSPGIHSLADILGFKNSIRLGQTANSKTIYEAVVAVPFLEKDGERKFFEIPRQVIAIASGDLSGTDAIDRAKANVTATGQAISEALLPLQNDDIITGADASAAIAQGAATAGANTTTAGTGELVQNKQILSMVNKMKKFIFPPRMDFIKNTEITPFAMYIFEFRATLSQCDLSKIWQNVLPDIGRSFESQEVSISHKLLSNELMGNFEGVHQESPKDEVQWMVFKVKQRAQDSYFEKTIRYKNDKTKNVSFDYSYNWPYDYFSLVEFVKMDGSIGFGTELAADLKVLGTMDGSNTSTADLLDKGVRSERPLAGLASQLLAETKGMTKEEKKTSNMEKRSEKRKDQLEKGAFGNSTRTPKDKDKK